MLKYIRNNKLVLADDFMIFYQPNLYLALFKPSTNSWKWAFDGHIYYNMGRCVDYAGKAWPSSIPQMLCCLYYTALRPQSCQIEHYISWLHHYRYLCLYRHRAYEKKVPYDISTYRSLVNREQQATRCFRLHRVMQENYQIGAEQQGVSGMMHLFIKYGNEKSYRHYANSWKKLSQM